MGKKIHESEELIPGIVVVFEGYELNVNASLVAGKSLDSSKFCF